MPSRALFLKSAVSLLAAAATPSPKPWDLCDQNPALPYDHPLELRMRVLDGPDFDLMKYRGNPVWLNVFATWCGPCAQEMPTVVATANHYYDRGLRVVGINFRESDNTVRAYRKRFSIPYPIAMDENGGFAAALERGGREATIDFPVSLFITPDGYLYCYHIGSMSDREIAYRVEKFLSDASASPSPSPTPHM